MPNNLPAGTTQRDIDDSAPGFAIPGQERCCEDGECRSRIKTADENGVSYTCTGYADCDAFRVADRG